MEGMDYGLFSLWTELIFLTHGFLDQTLVALLRSVCQLSADGGFWVAVLSAALAQHGPQCYKYFFPKCLNFSVC